MEESKYTILKNWFLSKSNLPLNKSNLYLQSQNHPEFLPIGAHVYDLPSDLELVDILEKWNYDLNSLVNKAIFLDDHYAIVPIKIENGKIYFVATYRE